MRSRTGVVVLVALIPLVALVIDPGGWYPFGPSKWLVVSVLVPAGVAALLWSRPLRWVRSITIAAWTLVGWLSLTAVVGREDLYAWIGTPERHLGVLAWALCGLALMAGQTLDPDADRGPVTWALAVAGLGAGAGLLAEALGFEPSAFDVSAGRLTATMGSAAYLGALTALLLPALVGIAADARLSRELRVAAGVGGVLVGIACVGSGARAAWFGLAAAAIVAAFVRRRTLLAHRRTVGVAVLVVLAGVVAVAVLSPAGARLGSAADADAPGGLGRIDEWRVATRVIARHPLVGVGPEGYRIAFAEGVDDAYERSHGRDPLPDRAHSAPLDLALAGGIPALAAWCAVVGLVLRACGRALRDDRGWLAGVGGGLVAHFVGQLLLFPTAELEPMAWMLAGLVVVATTPAPLVRERSVARPLAGALGAVAVIALLAGGRDLAADRQARSAVDAARSGEHELAVTRARDAVALRPDEVRLHLLLARMLLDADQGTRAALAAVDDALRVSPDDPIARLERARMLVRRAEATHLPEDVDAARADVGTLIAQDDSNATLWLLAGTAAALDGDDDTAERAFLRAEVLAPRSTAPSIELALLYLGAGRLDDAGAAADRALASDPDDRQAQETRARVDQAVAERAGTGR